MDEKKYDFAKVSARPATKREIDVLAAMRQRKVYEIVAEMLETWKLLNASDDETSQRTRALCRAYELGEQGQGALVRKLVNAEYEKLASFKLLQVEQPALSQPVSKS